MRVFIFREDCGELHVYTGPKAWAADMRQERDLPDDVIEEVLKKFEDSSVQNYADAAAEFFWVEVKGCNDEEPESVPGFSGPGLLERATGNRDPEGNLL